MAGCLVDVVELYVWHSVAVAGLYDGGGDLGLQAVVDDVEELGVGIAVYDMRQHVCEGRTEGFELFGGPVAPDEFPYRRIGPGVVGSAEYKQYVGRAEIVHAVDEGSFGIVFAAVACGAYRGAGIGVVLLQPVAPFLDELMPPGLLYVVDVGALGIGMDEIPHFVGLRLDEVLESGIGVSED